MIGCTGNVVVVILGATGDELWSDRFWPVFPWIHPEPGKTITKTESVWIRERDAWIERLALMKGTT